MARHDLLAAVRHYLTAQQWGNAHDLLMKELAPQLVCQNRYEYCSFAQAHTHTGARTSRHRPYSTSGENRTAWLMKLAFTAAKFRCVCVCVCVS